MVFGDVPQPDGKYPLKISTARDQTSVITTSAAALARSTDWVRAHSQPDYVLPVPRPKDAAKAASRANAAAHALAPATASNPAAIDLMVVYTPGLVDVYGSQTAVLTRIHYLVDLANQAYSLSKVYQTLRLVHTVEVSYPNNVSSSVALDDLKNARNGFQNIPALRSQYGADLVSLIRPSDAASVNSVAILGGGGGTTPTPDQAFSSLADLGDGTSGGRFTDHTFVHELGHNMGNLHEREISGGSDGAYPYSYGYRSPTASGFHDLMAYGVAGQIPYAMFSNPNLSICQHSPCGVPDNQSNSADTAHSMNNTAPIIAAYEPTKVGNGSSQNFMFARNDINGDGKSDLLWVNNQAGSFGYWTMSGPKVLSIWSTAVAKGYRIVATGDFNGDGKVDLVWTSPARDLYVWESDGTGFKTYYTGTYPAGWEVVGAGDVDANGRADLLWFNPSAPAYGYWIMDGPHAVRAWSTSVTPDWHIAALGDFNRDGKTDLVWQGPADGSIYLWVTNANGYTSRELGNPGNGFRVLGAGYVSGVSNEDVPKLLVSDPETNAFYYYNVYVDARTAFLNGSWGFQTAPGYSVAAVGDFNGSGLTDVMWTSPAHDLYLWKSNGITFDPVFVGTYPAGWSVVPSQVMSWSVSR